MTVPIISPVADATILQGNTYSLTPALLQGEDVVWLKEYGPDDLTVNSTTGAITWAIPYGLASESFHIGVRAANSDGVATEVWVLTVGNGNVIYCGPGETYTTIASATAVMSAGDTLIVRDGTYIGDSNIFYNENTRGTLAPNGVVGSYTTAMAETPGGVHLDGEGLRRPLRMYGSWADRSGHTPLGAYDVSYVAYKGFIVSSPNSNSCIYTNHVHHIKFIDCGAYDAESIAAPIICNRSNYILVEGCYTWGRGRMGSVFYLCDHSIKRRCVSRMDVQDAVDQPIGIFDCYSVQYGRMCNCIAIDTDQHQYQTGYTTAAGAFVDQSGSANNDAWAIHLDIVTSHSIALNIHNKFTLTQQNDYSDPVTFENCAGWGMKAIGNSNAPSYYGPIISSSDTLDIDSCTFGEWTSPHGALFDGGGSSSISFNGWSSNQTIVNSIVKDIKDFDNSGAGLFYDFETVNYNNIHDTGPISAHGTTDTNTITTDPEQSGLLYLPRIEPGSSLETAGNSGARVGAEILYMRGKAGTMWGEDGFDDMTTVPMWPFPHEDLIKEKMQEYSWTGAPTLGDRGFASSTAMQLDGVSPVTLTSCVWEALGNQMPTDIYGPPPNYSQSGLRSGVVRIGGSLARFQ